MIDDEIDRSKPVKDDHVLEIHDLHIGLSDTGAIVGKPQRPLIYFYWLVTNPALLEEKIPSTYKDGALNVAGIDYAIKRGVRDMPGMVIAPCTVDGEIPAGAYRITVAN